MQSTTIRTAALNFLARREHSQIELFNKLRAKNFDEAMIRAVIAALLKEGLINETRFVENFIHFRRGKGFGPLHIKAELIEKGISEELIEQELNIKDNAWLTDAHRVWRKRFKNLKPRDFKTRAQQMRFLHYRGFTQEQINHIFKNDEE